MSKIDELKKIKDEVLNLVDSPLYKYRTENKYLPVFGEGSHNAKIIFIGEAPGRNEAMTGSPFCGSAGKILDELLDSVKIDRKDIYITNIVKDRPQKNRDPLPEEIEIYGPFLDRQIEIIKPKVIVTLGRYAMNYIMNKYKLNNEMETIGKAHGKVYKVNEIDIVTLYHPCVAIYNRSKLKIL
jgi:DNA polymerase